MAGGGGSTGGIGAQSPASGGFGGNMGNASAGGFGGGYGGGMGFGGQPQRPMYGLGDSRGPNSSLGGNYDGRNSMTAPANGFGGFGMERPQVVGGFGGIEQDQEFLGYQKQGEDLSRQMNEYMQKAPMYQQLQELQGKMQGVQSRYAPPQRSFNQAPQQQRGFNPQQLLGGLAALLGGRGGMGGMGGMPQQRSYDQYLAGRNPMQHDVQLTREQYENPVQRQVNPANLG